MTVFDYSSCSGKKENEKREEKKMGTFGNWSEDIHSDPDQGKRMESAASKKLTPVSVDKEAESGEFVGKSGYYTTTLNQCTCGDFISRHKPCKHIYRLAYELTGFDLGFPVKADKKAQVTPDAVSINQEVSALSQFVDELPPDCLPAVFNIIYSIRNCTKSAAVADGILEYIQTAYTDSLQQEGV